MSELLQDDNCEAWHYQEQLNKEEYDRQQLMTCLQRVIDDDSSVILKLKAKCFLLQMKSIIEGHYEH